MTDWNDMTSGMGEPLGLTDKMLTEMGEEMMAVREHYKSMAELLRLLVEEEGDFLPASLKALLGFAAEAMEARAEKEGRSLYHSGKYIKEQVRQERKSNLIKQGVDP